MAGSADFNDGQYNVTQEAVGCVNFLVPTVPSMWRRFNTTPMQASQTMRPNGRLPRRAEGLRFTRFRSYSGQIGDDHERTQATRLLP